MIELVVVIAVIAILSAVSVVSYVAITNNAKQSADEQAVYQMNTALMADEIQTPSSIIELYEVLSEGGLSAKDYSPLYKNRYFYWDSSINRILYTDANETVLYPAAYKGQTYASMKAANPACQWYSLNSTIAKKDYGSFTQQTIGGVQYNTLSITSAGQLAKLSDDVEQDKLPTEFTRTANATGDGIDTFTGKVLISLDSDLDLMGASFSFTGFNNGNFELDGNNHTISGLVNSTAYALSNQNGQNIQKAYGAGIIGYNSKTSSVYFHDVTFKNCESGAYSIDVNGENKNYNNNGLLVGYNYGELTVENVSFVDCNVYANKRAGLICGAIAQKGEVTFKGNVSFDNCAASVKDSIAGIVLNTIKPKTSEARNDNNSKVTISSGATITVNSNCKVSGPTSGLYGVYAGSPASIATTLSEFNSVFVG